MYEEARLKFDSQLQQTKDNQIGIQFTVVASSVPSKFWPSE